jgi:uncharacterized membrane protein YfcA
LTPHLLVALALSTLVGVSLGLLGAGGSMLAVPILVYVARLEVRSAIGLSLAVVGGSALVGGLAQARAGCVDVRAAAVLAAGLGVGFLTGFLGIGGGFLIVPALSLLAGLSIHRAVGTSLPVIALSAAAGLAAHLRQGGLPLGLTAAFTAASALGALAGVRTGASLDPRRLRRAFAVAVIVVGLFLLFRNAAGG